MKQALTFTGKPRTAWRKLIASLALASGSSFAASPAWLTAHDKEIKELVSRMTLAEKAGQMTQPDLGVIKDSTVIETLSLGSILRGGSSDPKSGNILSDWQPLYLGCQEHAPKSRLGIPISSGIEAVLGHNSVLGAVANQADALVVAWLPGTEGSGVTEVLFGDADPTGTLSFTWPRSMAQIPRGQFEAPIDNLLFPLGFGLGY